MVASMNHDAILFAMANPVPEIMPDLAKKAGASVVGTGRSDFPNQVNNVVAFPGIFKGALEGRATQITEEMKLAAALAIASLVPEEELNEDNIMPEAFDPTRCRCCKCCCQSLNIPDQWRLIRCVCSAGAKSPTHSLDAMSARKTLRTENATRVSLGARMYLSQPGRHSWAPAAASSAAVPEAGDFAVAPCRCNR